MANLKKITTRSKKRLGRGYGSGKGGHTSSRGQKGQKSRNSVGILFEGMKTKKSLVKRLPLSRGKGKFKSQGSFIPVNLEALNILPNGSKVTIDLLAKSGIVDKKKAEQNGVKILGDGNLKVKLNISLPISKSAASKVEKAGGTVEIA